jgi:hypothetical protein
VADLETSCPSAFGRCSKIATSPLTCCRGWLRAISISRGFLTAAASTAVGGASSALLPVFGNAPARTILDHLSSVVLVLNAPSPGATLLFNGLRVRIGMHSGMCENSCLRIACGTL